MRGLAGREEAVLRPFFETLERDFNGSVKEKEYNFYVEIGGKKLMLCFPSREQAGILERYLAGRRIPETRSPDARFCFWPDDCSRYMGLEVLSGRWRYREKSSFAIFAPGSRLIGADVPNRTFYYCLHDPEKQAQIPYWAMNFLVSQWARTAELLPLHGGVVGVESRGVLLAAQSGSGKTTLATSCLLSGMDYVADDYVLVNSEGPLRAMPISSALNMNPDMKERLGLTLPVIWENAGWNGKQMLDASSFPLSQEMAVCAVVFLSGRDKEQAEISSASGYPAVRLIQSALRIEGTYDPLMAKAVVQRLSALPAYEMCLCGDLKQNADVLRAWIERME